VKALGGANHSAKRNANWQSAIGNWQSAIGNRQWLDWVIGMSSF